MGIVRVRGVWIVEMADEQFGWVICSGKGSPTTDRSQAYAAMRELKESFPKSKFRVTRYESRKP